MKTIIPIILSCLLLFGCSRKDSSQGQTIAFSGIATMHVQKRAGSTLEGVHLDMKAMDRKTPDERWIFDAKEGTMSNEPNGMVRLVLKDVQAKMGSKGSVHKARMVFDFRKELPLQAVVVSTNLPQFDFAATDLASPAVVATNRFGNVTFDFRLSGGKADELERFTSAHLNQQVEIKFGETVLTRPTILTPTLGGEFEVTFASSDTNAQTIADRLNQK